MGALKRGLTSEADELGLYICGGRGRFSRNTPNELRAIAARRGFPKQLHEMRELIAIPSQKLKVPRQEFRRSHRVDARLPCLCQRMHDKIVVPHIVHGAIRDIGYHGLMVELVEPLEPHGEIKLEFELPLVDYRAADVYARVVTLKQERDEWVAGLEFTSISAECHAKVQMFVQLLVAH